MHFKKVIPVLAAVAAVGVLWWITRPRGSASFGPLVHGPTFPAQPGVVQPNQASIAHGLELAPVAANRPENLVGQAYSNAEVDAILAKYRGGVLTAKTLM